VEFRLLGLLEVLDEGHRVRIGRGKESALLALLLLHANRSLSVDRLSEELWGERPPQHAAKTVQICVSRLRHRLDADRILTVPGGYMLRVVDGELDVRRFEQLALEGHRLLEAGEPSLADRSLTEALALCRGDPLAEFIFEEFAQADIARLAELRSSATADRIDARLALGDDESLIPAIQELVRAKPLWERPRRQLMLGLYRAGRQQDALATYRETRALLIEELGLEPSAELQALERDILRHAPQLERPPAPPAAASEAGATPARLPVPVNKLHGRGREVRELEALVRSGARLVTITGAGGCGKTRLAVAVASSLEPAFGGHRAFVSIATVRQPELVADAISAAVGIDTADATVATVKGTIGNDPWLLVLDNFEHVLPAATLLSELLSSCPRLTLLVTSRASLHLSAEHQYPLEPLTELDAAAMFVERAQAARPSFTASENVVSSICRRLDCLPLALELAAGHTRLFAAEELLERLDKRLDVLTSGPLDLDVRQQTLRETIEWSHELLAPDERRLLAFLAVFSGGCTFEAAATVCGATLPQLESLVDKNLVRWHEVDGEGRFSLLETVREYALERLDAEGSVEAACDSFSDYYLALIRQRVSEHDLGQTSALNQLERELDNFLEAFEWSHPPDPLPVPTDDGACAHLVGLEIPRLILPSTHGPLDLADLASELLVLYVYPGTTPLGRVPLPGLYEIPGGHGCSREGRGFRDQAGHLTALGARIAGLSVQPLPEQVEFGERTMMPFPLIADPRRQLADALGIPSFDVSGRTLYKRATMIASRGKVIKVFYPVFPPARNADEVAGWLRTALRRNETA
jgi:predicted ATPase/DNA-binding SARP family transcriptional activator/peroxiredoxin